VDSGDGIAVGEQDGQAVGGEHGADHVRRGGETSVCSRQRRGGIGENYPASVDLFEPYRLLGEVEALLEDLPV
jgi:hypothetical protein